MTKTRHLTLFLFLVVLVPLATGTFTASRPTLKETWESWSPAMRRMSAPIVAPYLHRSVPKVRMHAHMMMNAQDDANSTECALYAILPVFLATVTFPSQASAAELVVASNTISDAIPAVLASALWAYAHYLSILVITGCLMAERLLIQPSMSVQDEETVIKLDLVYGIMAAVLIVSGFARATKFGQGGDFYIHESLFWVKMTVSGIWGGLSLFPSLTFYKRNFARQKDHPTVPIVVPPLSTRLSARLHQVIHAELVAILSIPCVATLMARGVGYSEDLSWVVGLVTSLVATAGSFLVSARQAWGWEEEEEQDDGERTEGQVDVT